METSALLASSFGDRSAEGQRRLDRDLSKQGGRTCFARRAFLSATDPWYSSVRMLGAQVCSSASQLGSTEEGHTMRKGPLMLRASTRNASTEMTCTVFPSPCTWQQALQG